MPDQVVYVSKVHVERIRGPLRRITLPVEGENFFVSTHDEIATYYGHKAGAHPAHSTTLDYLVAATAGRLTGTLGGALEGAISQRVYRSDLPLISRPAAPPPTAPSAP